MSDPVVLMLKDTFNTESGLVILQYPATMSPDTYEDIKSWLQLEIRKIARTVEDKK
jgi:hypothetical protein